MNILDENIPENQRQLLRSWRIKVRQIGHEVGREGMKDDEIISQLHRLAPVTFFTRDLGFYHHHFCHAKYCLVCLAVSQYEVASFIRSFLRHSAFRTQAKRMGKVIRVTNTRIRIWQLNTEKEEHLIWVK